MTFTLTRASCQARATYNFGTSQDPETNRSDAQKATSGLRVVVRLLGLRLKRHGDHPLEVVSRTVCRCKRVRQISRAWRAPWGSESPVTIVTRALGLIE